MDMTGEYTIAAPREEVWKALNDEAVLKICIPGSCNSMRIMTDRKPPRMPMAIAKIK